MSTNSSETSTNNQEQFVDLSDDSLGDVVISGFSADADPFAQPAPPDDGQHIVKLSFFEADPSKRWKRQDGGHFSAKVICTIIEGEPFAGRKMFDYMVSTKINQSGSTRAAGIIRALGERPLGSHKDQARQLNHLIEQSPMCRVTTMWHLRQSIQEDGKYTTVFEKKGQKNFPPLVGDDGLDTGKKQHILTSSYDGDQVVAQADVMSYHPLN